MKVHVKTAIIAVFCIFFVGSTLIAAGRNSGSGFGARSAGAQRAGSQGLTITHGPIVGGLRADGARIWARSSKPGRFNVVYGHAGDDEWDRVEIVTSLDRDNTGWVELEGLRSDTKYYYELELLLAPDATGKGGWFRTLPAEDDFRDSRYNPDGLFNFSFEFACGNSPRAVEVGLAEPHG